MVLCFVSGYPNPNFQAKTSMMAAVMMRMTMLLLLAAALLSSAEAAVACPPPGFDSASGFDIKQYVQGPWYIQEQVSPSFCLLPAARLAHASTAPADTTHTGCMHWLLDSVIGGFDAMLKNLFYQKPCNATHAALLPLTMCLCRCPMPTSPWTSSTV